MEITKAEISSAAAAQNASNTPELMGSEILVKSLQAEGLQYIWGSPGGAALYNLVRCGGGQLMRPTRRQRQTAQLF